jgi:hypothetical protein
MNQIASVLSVDAQDLNSLTVRDLGLIVLIESNCLRVMINPIMPVAVSNTRWPKYVALSLNVLIATVYALSVSGASMAVPARKIPCKTPEIAAECYWTRGRLANYNGTPTLRMWKVGTKRILAIHSGPGYKRGDDKENENPEIPENVERAFQAIGTLVFADFEVCPLTPERPGVMQSVCIESAKNIVVGH